MRQLQNAGLIALKGNEENGDEGRVAPVAECPIRSG
jgi:hypothetical protein